ncbi:MAG: hexitol phosphatase HxpB [Bacteroidales bacterium]|nr:hexitol phosphatase HxpB [Bacteroidales bacterium]MCF8389722.1 hexitol phosphatase HxpB [Bacteroidales bacterium]
MIEAVIFDMDGILIDSETFWQETERTIMKDYGIEIKKEMQKDSFGLCTAEQIAFWYNYKPWPNPDFAEIEKNYDGIMLNYFNTRLELMPGVTYILDFFKKKGLKIALASSSNLVLIEAFVKRFNLGHYFDVIHSAENEEYAKPHPAVYIGTAKRLSINPMNCMAIEDSIHGVISAKAARMKVVAIPDKVHYHYPEYVIADLKLKSLNELGEKEFNSINNHKI